MKKRSLITVLTLLLPALCLGQTWSKWDGVTVGPASGNIGKWSNLPVGTTAGNMGKWNNLASPATTTAVTVLGECSGTASAKTVSCTASGGGNAGDLVVVHSQDQNTSGTPVAIITSSQCTPWFPLSTSNNNGTGMAMNDEVDGCFLTSTVTPTVQADWTAANGTSTQIQLQVVHSSGGWNTPLLDRNDSAVNSSSTNCPFGSTGATRNPNDYLFVSCALNSGTHTFTAPGGYALSSVATTTHTGIMNQLLSSIGTQGATATFTTAGANTGTIVALQAAPPASCSGCTYVTGVNSANQTVNYDHPSISGVANGDTLIYCGWHSNTSGSGTAVMTDSTGLNYWVPIDHSVSPAISVTASDHQMNGTYAGNCWISHSVISPNGGKTGTIVADATFSDCATSCPYVGGFFAEVSGGFNWDGYSVTVSGATSGSGSDNANCGTASPTHTNDMIFEAEYAPAGPTFTAGSVPAAFTAQSVGGTTNGRAQTLIWSASGSVTPTFTLGTASTAYQAFCVYLR